MTRSLPFVFLLRLWTLCFSAGLIENALHLTSNDVDLSTRFMSPSFQHFLGTDELGRDVFIRLLYGGQVSLIVSGVAGLLAAAIGTTIGMIAGYTGGKWDALLMRYTDFVIALPTLPLLIILSALDMSKLGFSGGFNANLYKIIAIISLLGWTTVARLSRARTLTIKEMDFVRAARALGMSNARILLRHILPNLFGTIVVATSLAMGGFLMTESTLSFLGLGIQPPLPSWGNMLTNAQETIWEHARLTVYPGAMIFVTVLAFNFLGDRLQNRLDPKSGNRI
ncbi:MAG: ABC transporter permease [Alphaproteobacteria bacterium]|nr:ABC transporter permease [Alphaproteobacteria bacterium]